MLKLLFAFIGSFLLFWVMGIYLNSIFNSLPDVWYINFLELIAPGPIDAVWGFIKDVGYAMASTGVFSMFSE